MGKGEQLWDDSALLNAFDAAMSNYKKMHSKKTKDNSTDVEAICGSIAEESDGAIRDAEEKINSVSVNTLSNLGVGETENLSPVQEDHPLESPLDASSGQHKQEVNDYSYSQNLEGYNQLLSQYYELEEKRQMILNQLHQFGGYDYQTSSEGFGSLPPNVACSCCCPCASHCLAAPPCTSFQCCGTCAASKTCDNSSSLTCHEKPAPLTDGETVKTAMAAAEKALSSIKLMESTNSSTQEEEKGKDNVDGIAQSMSSETDLSLVLNAWYSAGFYTGKYLTEQSKKGK